MSKTTLLVGVAAGYVLGARAGRERYEQIKTGARKVARDPRVQAATHHAADVAKDKVSDAASQAVDKVRREASIQPAP
jgi:hypothetical protein